MEAIAVPCHWFWAKLGKHSWPDRFHHAVDVGRVAAHLWDHLRPSQRGRIADALHLDPDAAGRWITFWIAAHDIGKVTPCFQFGDNSEKLKASLATSQFDSPPGNEHHTNTGTKVLFDALIAGGESWQAIPASREAKRMAAILLDVLAGSRTPTQAAETLGVSLPRYYQLESRALDGLLMACEPRPRGRQTSSKAADETLRRDNERLRRELSRQQQSLVRLTQRTLGVASPVPVKETGR
ncbi:MAG: HD domain-containing protein [Gemmataceae bacterium]